MLHGWGMHGGIWGEVVPQLAQHFRVHCVDLPGHGYSKAEKGEEARGKRKTSEPQLPFPLLPSPFSLDAIVSELSVQFDEPVNVCGWSLGGMIAQRWAVRDPGKIKRLVLVASTPCFAEREDWLFGMAADTLRQFAAELERDYAATLRRFLALQMRGSASERALLADLRTRLFSRGEPDIDALRAGLNILRDADLRTDLPAIRQPTLVISGERDRLTPPQASACLAQNLPDARMVEIKGAAHAPFLSHPEIFVAQLMDFMQDSPQI
ncbi:MAG: alpha/beta fold hydrolase [Nitrosomonadales bacterium]|nr:alpha/beta fold hydrolase [Nitrosomonadales bacterium]